MDPILLQKQLRENASDLNDFYKDLQSWGEDMKKKESAKTQNNNVKTSVPEKRKDRSPKKKKIEKEVIEKPKTKLGYTDYSAWDKFDAEAECGKIDYDENDESDLTDECDETVRDEAYLQKEKGNNFVKNKNWDKAIECYTKAIDCYSYDPVFYANRALCFLKKENYQEAEADCVKSIKLDSTYVKAFQRRAAAREALGKLREAEEDLLRVLELEPKNKESTNNLQTLRKKIQETSKESNYSQRPVSKFTASRSKKLNDANRWRNNTNNFSNSASPLVDTVTEKSQIEKPSDDIILVKAVAKPVHLQSKTPLKRIAIQETEVVEEPIRQNQAHSLPSSAEPVKTLKTDDLKVIERQSNNVIVPEMIKDKKNHSNNIKMSEIQLELGPPTNAVQFYAQWRHLKTIENKYLYLKIIKPENLPHIFKESLESNAFSEILEVLVKCFMKSNEEIFYFLKYFSEIRRFSTLIMFFSEVDKSYLRKLFDYVQQRKEQSNEDIDLLLKKYDLI